MSTTRRVATALLVALPLFATQPAHAQLSTAPPPITTYAADPGHVGDPASWRTPEFLRDNGMLSIGAEFAYAAGYSGTGMNIGIVDSGIFEGHMREHGSLDTNYTVGDRFFSVTARLERRHHGGRRPIVAEGLARRRDRRCSCRHARTRQGAQRRRERAHRGAHVD